MELKILFVGCSSIICALLLQVNQTTAAAASVTFNYATTLDFRAQTDINRRQTSTTRTSTTTPSTATTQTSRRQTSTTRTSTTTPSTASETNLALNKPAWQSTTISATHPASKAVNGVKSQYITTSAESDKDCSHTKAGGDGPDGALSWWAVDLSQNIKVSHVVITGRSDGLVEGPQNNTERLKNFYIGVTNVAPNVTAPVLGSSSMCALVGPAPSAPTYSIDVTCLSDTAAGRYLVVQFVTTSNFLTLCEVEVYGTPAFNFPVSVN